MTEIAPRMSDREAEAFRDFTRCSTSYFEFGIGGSTYWAGRLVSGRVVAIDSDPAWVEQAKSWLEPSPHVRNLVHVDIGPTKEWGYPVDTSEPLMFRKYFRSIIEYEPAGIDFCLVDGRFRVACFLTALKYTRDDTIIAIHDYRSRPAFHIAEEFGRIVMEVEDISFFIRRPELKLAKLEDALDAYAAIPS